MYLEVSEWEKKREIDTCRKGTLTILSLIPNYFNVQMSEITD